MDVKEACDCGLELPDCGEKDDSFTCTRPKGHSGIHIACGVAVVSFTITTIGLNQCQQKKNFNK